MRFNRIVIEVRSPVYAQRGFLKETPLPKSPIWGNQAFAQRVLWTQLGWGIGRATRSLKPPY
ncbi:hypothetical protein [Brasilonema bromeliae]|uniref:hypothetical protein n=1 Tax=Brasilonema bromeliae TaxID=383615 RepID=UPI00145CC6B2|nr:hypothetical protein [Brasilonema bromeliae]